MVIVDANNVVHARGDGGRPDAVVRLLELTIASRYASRGAVLVCDGSAGGLSPGSRAALVKLMSSHSGGGCRLVYAGPDREADDVIEGMIAAATDPSHLLVVSSDSRLRSAAYTVGAPWISSDEFAAHLEKDRDKVRARAAPTSDGLDPASVAWWMRYFGVSESGEPARPARAAETPAPKLPSPKAKRPHGAPAPPVPARPVPKPPSDDWLREAAHMWPGMFDPAELDMERVLAAQPVKKRRRKK